MKVTTVKNCLLSTEYMCLHPKHKCADKNDTKVKSI